MKQPGAIFTKGRTTFVMVASRELRRVPLTWQHPTDAAGAPLPLYERDPESAPDAGPDQGIMPDFSGIPDDQMGVAVYETTTEGIPITPVFPATREGLFQLLHYCTEHCGTFATHQTDIDGWARILGLAHVLEGRAAS